LPKETTGAFGGVQTHHWSTASHSCYPPSQVAPHHVYVQCKVMTHFLTSSVLNVSLI